MYRPTLLGFARTTFPLSGASRSVLVATEGRYVLVPERIEWTNHGIQFSLFGICMDTCMYSYIYIYIPLDEHTFSGSIGLSFRGLYQYLLNPSQGVFGCLGCM